MVPATAAPCVRRVRAGKRPAPAAASRTVPPYVSPPPERSTRQTWPGAGHSAHGTAPCPAPFSPLSIAPAPDRQPDDRSRPAPAPAIHAIARVKGHLDESKLALALSPAEHPGLAQPADLALEKSAGHRHKQTARPTARKRNSLNKFLFKVFLFRSPDKATASRAPEKDGNGRIGITRVNTNRPFPCRPGHRPPRLASAQPSPTRLSLQSSRHVPRLIAGWWMRPPPERQNMDPPHLPGG